MATECRHSALAHATSRIAGPERLPNVTGKQPFEEVVAVHGAMVLRVCRGVLGTMDADDAWSETFLSAMRAYPALAAGANVEAWLATIAHHKAIDVTRAAARRPIPVAETPDTVAAPPADRRELDLDDELGEAFAALPAKQKQSVAYHYLAGLPYTEVAAILGGNPDAARRAAADGIATLRRTYAGGMASKGELR
jgi:RNA polymerase sigma factor (sigma-70 family)